MYTEAITLALSMLIPCAAGALIGKLTEKENPIAGGGIGMALGYVFGFIILL